MLNTAWLRARGRAWSTVAIDGAIASYAVWTVACHAVMLLGGNTYALVATAATCLGVAVIGGGLFAWRAWRRRKPPAATASTPTASSPAVASESEAPQPVPSSSSPVDVPAVGSTPALREQLFLAALALVIGVLWLVFADRLTLWISLVAYAGIASALCLRSTPPVTPDPGTNVHWHEAVVCAVALVFAFLAVFAHRWRNDDCYYVNLAVTTADLPKQALLSSHTIHALIPGIPDSNLVFPPYRVHTWEALGGVIAFLTDKEAISVMHIGMSCVAAFLIPLAYARLFRLLDPERWLWLLIAVALYFTFEGSGDRGYSNQAFIRASTGKSVMLSVAIPALTYYGMAFAQRPSRLGFALFVAAQISAIGLSSTGLWLAPMVGMVAIAVPLPLRPASIRIVLFGLLGCMYVVAMALWVRGQMTHGMDAASAATDAAASASANLVSHFKLLRSALSQNIGPSRVTSFYLAAMLLALPLCRNALARRYLAAFYLVLVLLLMNPFLIDFMRFNVLGKSTVQRAMWFAPVPAAVAICLVAAIPSASAAFWQRAAGVGALLLAAAVVFSTVPSRYVLSSRNNVAFHWPPRVKVPESAFSVVRHLTKKLPTGSIVLAPELVSWYLPTVRHHPFPLLANPKYMRASPDEELARINLAKIVRGTKPFSKTERRRLAKGIERYDLAAVVLAAKTTRSSLKRYLRTTGYRRADKWSSSYDVWLAPKRKPLASKP